MNFQKDQKQDTSVGNIHSPLMDQEKDSSDPLIPTTTTDSKDNILIPPKVEPISSSAIELPNNNLEEESLSSNDQHEDTQYSLKIKPYYSINAKLNQRERKQFSNAIQTIKNIDKTNLNINIQGSLNECVLPMVDEHNTLIENNLKTESNQILESDNTNFGFLNTSTVISSRTAGSQGCNKTSVTCLICGKQLSNQYNLRVHMETHSNSSYSCTACPHVSRSRDALRKHVSYRHPVASPQKRPRCSSSKP